MKRVNPIPHNDQQTIEEICDSKPDWPTHKDIWIQAIRVYASASGNPWIVKPAVFSSDISSDLKKLYASRRGSGHIKRIREFPFTGCCPLCGSLSAGTVDHFLPKDVFPEFSVYSLNLIPVCSHCNSDEKGATYVGKSAPARLIHPYFDKIGDKPIVSVAFKKPYEAVEITAIPDSGLSGDELEIVRFHLQELLGKAFRSYVTNLWSTLPATVAASFAGQAAEVKVADTQIQIQRILTYNEITTGINSWPTAFYRGVLADPSVIDYVTQKATAPL